MKQEQRIEQAQGLGWQVGWRTPITAGLYFPGLNYDWIEVQVNDDSSCWLHCRKLQDGGERVVYDSGATRVKSMHFVSYLRRLVAAGVTCQQPRRIPPSVKPLL